MRGHSGAAPVCLPKARRKQENPHDSLHHPVLRIPELLPSELPTIATPDQASSIVLEAFESVQGHATGASSIMWNACSHEWHRDHSDERGTKLQRDRRASSGAGPSRTCHLPLATSSRLLPFLG